jgi:hypothetical protein
MSCNDLDPSRDFPSEKWQQPMDFSFSVHFNQPCDLSCANIVEVIAESDPIFIPDIFK